MNGIERRICALSVFVELPLSKREDAEAVLDEVHRLLDYVFGDRLDLDEESGNSSASKAAS